MLSAVTTWHLEMRAPPERHPPRSLPTALRIERLAAPRPDYLRYLYAAVGMDWHWHDRLAWNWERWQRYLARDAVQVWVAYADGAPAGYIELEAQCQGEVEIVYFGLLPQAIGRGLGRALLMHGIEQAWQAPATRRLWVHTCSLDHPNARSVYRSVGFKVFRCHSEQRPLPTRAQPWAGADRPAGA